MSWKKLGVGTFMFIVGCNIVASGGPDTKTETVYKTIRPDAEIITDEAGRPEFKVTGTVAAKAAELGIATIHVSLSHDAGIASAVVICEA